MTLVGIEEDMVFIKVEYHSFQVSSIGVEEEGLNW